MFQQDSYFEAKIGKCYTYPMPKVGAHVSAAVSLDLSFDRAENIGAECTQIFISPPQQWTQAIHNTKEIQAYKRRQTETDICPNFIHAAYLINLGSINPDLVQKSTEWLIYSQKTAEQLGIEGTIFHLGSYKKNSFAQALKQTTNALESILKSAPKAFIILENSAGAGKLIGDQFSEIGQIIKTVGNNRVKVCLDTQHAFASGYDLKTKEGLEETLQIFDQEIGLDRLVVVHANDSKTEFNSHKDRHENIGQGLIGIEGFRNLLYHPSLQNIPFILEVPGFENGGPDEGNIQTLKKLRIK